METQKIEMILGFMRKRDKIGSLLGIALGCLQQVVGTSIPVLQLNYQKFHMFSTASWLKPLWEFLHDIEGDIVFPKAWTSPKTFRNDVNISKIVQTWNTSDDIKYTTNMC